MIDWIIAAAALTVALIAVCITWAVRSHARRVELAQARQETERLRAENIDMRREIAGLERDLEAEQAHADDLDLEIERLHEELRQGEERIQRAESRRTDAEKEVFASRMRLEQLQNQLGQARAEQSNQEKLYQDIIREREEVVAQLQEKLHKRRKKKKTEPLDQQITLEDILNM